MEVDGRGLAPRAVRAPTTESEILVSLETASRAGLFQKIPGSLGEARCLNAERSGASGASAASEHPLS